MAGLVKRKGNSSQPPTGQATTGYGWQRPGFISLPLAANDNQLTAARLLRQPRFWVWTALVLITAAYIATRV